MWEEAASSCNNLQLTNLEIEIIAIASLIVVLELTTAERKYSLDFSTMIRIRKHETRGILAFRAQTSVHMPCYFAVSWIPR